MTLARLEAAGLVPVIRATGPAQALALSSALVEGGVRALEVTMTVPDAPRLIAELIASFGDQVVVGAGTVTNAQELSVCLDAGAEFIVTPICVPELVAGCHALGRPIALGAVTPTEVWRAHHSGADLVKVFPISCFGGAAYMSALRGPFPAIRLMPTGGVTLTNMHEYIQAGARVLGIGSALANTDLLEANGPEAVAVLARNYCQRYRALTANSLDSA